MDNNQKIVNAIEKHIVERYNALQNSIDEFIKDNPPPSGVCVSYPEDYGWHELSLIKDIIDAIQSQEKIKRE